MSVPTNSGDTPDSADHSHPLEDSRDLEVPRETDTAAKTLFGDRLELARTYAEALATTGAERGLIGPREVPRIWDRHLLNCVALAELIPSGVELADVGSGAGLPGLPIAIARPDVTVYLVEPLLRRVVWLREVVLQLGLSNVEIIRGRANAVAETDRAFDVVTARAVAPLPGLLDLCLPLVRPGGELLAMKGDSAAEELIEAEATLKQLGAVEWSVAVCGQGVLATPTTVVRVVAGKRRPAGPKAGSKKASNTPRPKRAAAPAQRAPSAGGRRSKRR
jgi:16S rRNA (guanine527-N7)-methyltransferase